VRIGVLSAGQGAFIDDFEDDCLVFVVLARLGQANVVSKIEIGFLVGSSYSVVEEAQISMSSTCAE